MCMYISCQSPCLGFGRYFIDKSSRNGIVDLCVHKIPTNNCAVCLLQYISHCLSCSLPLARSLSLSLATHVENYWFVSICSCKPRHMHTHVAHGYDHLYSIHKDMFNCLDILDISNLVSVAMLRRFAHFPAICWIFSMQLWHVKESPGTIRYWKM